MEEDFELVSDTTLIGRLQSIDYSLDDPEAMRQGQELAEQIRSELGRRGYSQVEIETFEGKH